MKVDLGIWGKLSWVVTILALAGGMVLVVGWYLPLINQNQRMRQEILRQNVQIQQEEKTERTLKLEIDALQHDPKTVERLAREKLGYAKPDETIIRFEDSTNSSH